MAGVLIQEHKRSKLEILGQPIIFEQPRTSSLPSPVMRMEGHRGEINSCKFHPWGQLLMSAGYDGNIFIRSVYGESDVAMVLQGHIAPIMETQFSPDGSKIYSASMDQTLGIWHTGTGALFSVLDDHKSDVNTVQTPRNSNNFICSGSDDGTIRLWDVRYDCAVQVHQSGHPVLASCFSQNGNYIISGGVDNLIKIWDIRMNGHVGILYGHDDVISGLALSPCGKWLLSNSGDNTLRIWDIENFEDGDTCVDIFLSNQVFAEPNYMKCAWSKNNLIAAGSSYGQVCIWDIKSRQIVYDLGFHKDSVIDVDFHPIEPIIVSGSKCENLYFHEL